MLPLAPLSTRSKPKRNRSCEISNGSGGFCCFLLLFLFLISHSLGRKRDWEKMRGTRESSAQRDKMIANTSLNLHEGVINSTALCSPQIEKRFATERIVYKPSYERKQTKKTPQFAFMFYLLVVFVRRNFYFDSWSLSSKRPISTNSQIMLEKRVMHWFINCEANLSSAITGDSINIIPISVIRHLSTRASPRSFGSGSRLDTISSVLYGRRFSREYTENMPIENTRIFVSFAGVPQLATTFCEIAKSLVRTTRDHRFQLRDFERFEEKDAKGTVVGCRIVYCHPYQLISMLQLMLLGSRKRRQRQVIEILLGISNGYATGQSLCQLWRCNRRWSTQNRNVFV